MGGVGGAESGEEGVVLVDDDVDGNADEVGRGEVTDCVEDGAEGGAPDSGSVGFAIAEQAREGRTAHIKAGRIINIAI